jgi:2Fe-2S ferredoxin
MARLRVIFENGDPERVIEFDPARAPFQHDGRPGSILDVLLANGIDLEHACGGNCACTTCHVIVKQGSERLSPSDDSEDDLLDKAPGLTPTSRLGCQAVVQDADAEIVVVVPRYTINQISAHGG